ALGAVDDEGPVDRHQRDLTEVDLLLLDVTDGLRAGLLVLVPDDQADDDLDGRRVGHATLVALVDVVLGLLQVVADELQARGLVEVPDRKDRLEDTLKADVLALLRGNVLLEELVVGLLLDADQVRDVDRLRDLREGLPDSEVVLDLRRHALYSRGARRTGGRLGGTGSCIEKIPAGFVGPSGSHRNGQSRPPLWKGMPAALGAGGWPLDPSQPPWMLRGRTPYLISTVAPAAVSCSLILAASSLETSSL